MTELALVQDGEEPTRLMRYKIAAVAEDGVFYAHNPELSFEAIEVRLAEKPQNDTLPFLSFLSGLGSFIFLLMGSLMYFGADESGDLNKVAQMAQGQQFLTIGLALAILPASYLLYSLIRGPRELQPDLEILMPAAVGKAWEDWSTALLETVKLDRDGEGHQALLAQDAVLRPALHAYLTDESVSAEQKQAFETHLFQTCADGYELLQAERTRAELHRVYEANAITLALQSPSPLPAALDSSRMYANNVREALGD